jgi:superfamily I DNA/RNA helicase
MDFDDVIPMVTEFLSSNPSVAGEYSKSIKWMMVDEYQDTNPIQEKLVNLINSEYVRYV